MIAFILLLRLFRYGCTAYDGLWYIYLWQRGGHRGGCGRFDWDDRSGFWIIAYPAELGR